MEFNSMNQTPERPVNYREAQTRRFLKDHGSKAFVFAVILIALLILLGESVFIVGEA